jgi:hypothetical protein
MANISLGRPDYDAGDLVVCVRTRNPDSKLLGQFFVVREVCFHADSETWAAVIHGLPSPCWNGAWDARAFKRFNPKPVEFFAGRVEEPQREQVPA